MRISYTSNRTAETFVFDGTLAIFNSSDILGWKWESQSNAGSASARHYREAREATAYLTFQDKSLAMRFFALADQDTALDVAGTLTISDWSLDCNMVSGSSSFLVPSAGEYEVSFRAEDPRWYHITNYSFPPSSPSSSTGLDYPHDYPHDYGPPPSGRRTISNGSLYPCEFQLTVFGPAAASVSITMGGNRYRVNLPQDLQAGELLFVNSHNKGIPRASVFIRRNDGTTVDCFRYRGRGLIGSGDYPFELVSPGAVDVSWSGLFGFDLQLMEMAGMWQWN